MRIKPSRPPSPDLEGRTGLAPCPFCSCAEFNCPHLCILQLAKLLPASAFVLPLPAACILSPPATPGCISSFRPRLHVWACERPSLTSLFKGTALSLSYFTVLPSFSLLMWFSLVTLVVSLFACLLSVSCRRCKLRERGGRVCPDFPFPPSAKRGVLGPLSNC